MRRFLVFMRLKSFFFFFVCLIGKHINFFIFCCYCCCCCCCCLLSLLERDFIKNNMFSCLFPPVLFVIVIVSTKGNLTKFCWKLIMMREIVYPTVAMVSCHAFLLAINYTPQSGWRPSFSLVGIGIYNSTSIPNERFFEKIFHGKFLLSHFAKSKLSYPWPGIRTLALRLICQRTTYYTMATLRRFTGKILLLSAKKTDTFLIARTYSK